MQVDARTNDTALILILMEIALGAFTSGTLAYHFCLVFSLPASAIFLPSLSIFALYFYLNISRYRDAFLGGIEEFGYVAIVVACGTLLGVLLLIVSRPNADDVQFFYSALLQIQDLSRPFISTTEVHNVKLLPKSSIGVIPFYEQSVALASKLLHIDPLHSYQNVSIFIASIGFFLIYVLIYRELGLTKNTAVVGVAFAIIFLFIDGNEVRSFGNVTLVRMWQGKSIMWTLIVPLSMIATHRFMRNPSASRYVLILFCLISGLGLSATGLFLIPCTVFATSLAYYFSRGFQFRDIKNCAIVNTSSAYSAFIYLYTYWGANWFENLQLVIPDATTLLRNFLLLLIVPLFALRPPFNRVLPLVTLTTCLLYLNPFSGPVIFETITAGSYWRLVYIVPLPLAAGLVGAMLSDYFASKLRDLKFLFLLVLASILTWISHENNVLFSSKENKSVWYKHPTDYRFRPDDFEMSKIVADMLTSNDHLLAPQRIIHIVPLLNPSVSLETARSINTRFVFTNAGQPEEGRRRVLVQRLVTSCRRSRSSDKAFRSSVENGITAIVIRRCEAKLLNNLDALIRSTGDWERKGEKNGYIFYVKSNH